MLGDLGDKINAAFRSLGGASVVDEALLDSVLKEICLALLQSDVNVKLVQTLRKNIKSIVNLNDMAQGVNKKRKIQSLIVNELCALVDPGVEPYKPTKGKANVIMFVGLQGSGKTTTCTKLAHYYQRKNFKVGLVCTDTFRAGAFDQLKQNATKAKIPYYGSYTEADPVQLALEGVSKFKNEGFEIIIVDSKSCIILASGRHHQETALFEEMKQISGVVKPDNVVFVLDGTIGQAAEAHARAFKDSIDVGSIIITKLDGHAKGGGAVTAVATIGAPIQFIGVGEQIHDLETFNARSFISKMLGMGDLTGLMESVQDMAGGNQLNMIMKLQKGEFSIRDMRDQLKMIAGMGPMSKIIGMIPGMNADMLGPMGDADGAKKLTGFMCAMDSMTAGELDSDSKIFHAQPTRVTRIAKGSGVLIGEIEELLAQFAQMEKMIKTIGGKNGLLQSMTDPKKSGNRSANPNQQAAQMQQAMQKMMPPGMMDQMGGFEGMQKMMQQMMGGKDGMPDMSALAGMMGGGMPDIASMMSGMGQKSQPTARSIKPKKK